MLESTMETFLAAEDGVLVLVSVERMEYLQVWDLVCSGAYYEETSVSLHQQKMAAGSVLELNSNSMDCCPVDYFGSLVALADQVAKK